MPSSTSDYPPSGDGNGNGGRSGTDSSVVPSASTGGSHHGGNGDGDGDGGRPDGYKRARGELLADPFHGTNEAPSGRREGGAQGKQPKNLWKEHALSNVAPRPGFNEQGRKIDLLANTYRLRVPSKKIYHYDVSFSIPGLDKHIKWNRDDAKRVWAAFAASQPKIAHIISIMAFDGLKNAYSPVKIPFEPIRELDQDGRTVQQAPGGDQTEGAQLEEGNFPVTFKLGNKDKTWILSLALVNTVDMQKLLDYTNPRSGADPIVHAAAPDVPPTLQALDILFRAHISKEFTISSSQNRKWFKPNFQSSPLPLGAEVLRGMFLSARPTINGPGLQIDSAHAAYIKGGPLKDVVMALSGAGGGGGGRGGYGGGRGGFGGGRGGYGGGGGGGIGSGINPDWRRMKKYLKGARLNFTHRTLATPVTLFGFSRGSAREEMFEMKPRRRRGDPEPTGDEPPPEVISVADYYYRAYNLVLQRPDWPCVDIKEKRMRVPVEFCILLPGQPVGFTLMQPEQTAAMIQISAKPPMERRREIDGARDNAGFEESHEIKGWGVEVSPRMTEVPGMVLPSPHIHFHPGSRQASPNVSAGTWNLTQSKFIRPGVPLESWAFLSFDHRTDVERMKPLALAFIQVLEARGLSVPNQRPVLHQGSHDLLRSLKETGKRCVTQAGRPPQLIMVIVPDRLTYEALKRHLVSDLPVLVPSQFMMANKCSNPNPRQADQYLNNVSMKVNLKLGGSNWKLSPDDLPPNTMILGADVTHPNPGSRAASMAAVCSSTDPSASDVRAEIRCQDQRVEVITRMDECVRAHLVAWREKNGSLPQKIVCFRDGISEGEIGQVLETEVALIKKACAEFSTGPDNRIGVTYVSAGKRHHQRFFAAPGDAQRMLDRKGNLPPGVVVDRIVTHPLIYDFYLQAHAGLIGTAKTTHYCVLADENNFSAESIQKLTNSLSYVFGRATRSVSLVTPAYYADIALEKCRVLGATEFDDASTTLSSHSGNNEPAPGVLDPHFFTAKLNRAPGFANAWFM